MRRVAFSGVFLVVLALTLPSPTRAGFVYYAGTGHYYGLTSTVGSWNEAEAEAVALGGHLASVTSQDENDFLVATFLTAPQATSVPLWLGGTDQAEEGTFVWTTGEPFAFTSWHNNEPNNNGDEDYIAIGWHFASGLNVPRGTWNDTPLGGTIGFGGNTNGPYRGIIELNFNPDPVPEPASVALLGTGFLSLVAVRRFRRRNG